MLTLTVSRCIISSALITALTLGGNGWVHASAPLKPDEALLSDNHHTELFSLSRLQVERQWLTLRRDKLPPSSPSILNNRFGYHSEILPPLAEGETEEERWIEIQLRRNFVIHAICLLPAFNPETGSQQAYGFPRRFSIDLAHLGRQKTKRVVDWREQDFPDPGLSPVVFELRRPFRANRIRIDIQKGADDSRGRFFALAEVLIIAKPRNYDFPLNCAPWPQTEIRCSDQLIAEPYWSPAYLNDQIHSLSQYLGMEQKQDSGLEIELPAGWISTDRPLQIDIDLGHTQRLGKVSFYATRRTTDVALPTFGFPTHFLLKASESPTFDQQVRERTLDWGDRIPSASHTHTIFLTGHRVRYLRLIITDLPEVNGRQYFALGEITVNLKNHMPAPIQDISIHGLPEGITPDLSPLIDGFSNGRKIIPEWDSILMKAKRRKLDLGLTEIEQIIARIKKRRTLAFRGLAAGLLLILLTGLILQFIHRRRALLMQHRRITRDLHDDVGSSIGSINLAIDRLLTRPLPPETAEELTDISLNTREAASALKEIFRFEDIHATCLPDLMERMHEKAKRILPDHETALHTEGALPAQPLSMEAKRNLRLLCKEIFHNCAKHAQADIFQIIVSNQKPDILLTFRDNGTGFDPSRSSTGLGLSSLKERAESMGGSVCIESAPNEGTSIEIRLPLGQLLTKRGKT